MTPAARIQAAAEVLDDWRRGVPAEKALTTWARGARYAGSTDRRIVRDHVYDVLRTKGVCVELGGGETGRALVIGLARSKAWPLGEIFTGMGHAPAELTLEEREAIMQRRSAARVLDTPGWLRDRIEAAHGAATPDILAAMAERAPLYLRVNVAWFGRDDAIARLAEDGITAVAEPGCATALRVTEGGRALDRSTAYAQGMVEPQDLSVQLACAAVDWPPGGGILDYCAGGGGKALAIAAATGGPVDVHDANPARMVDLPARALRAGADLHPVDDPSGPYEVVLTDVPCSGSGTWRRDPEAKWRLREDELQRLTRVQDGILDAAGGLVAPGGRLVYMTCSLLAEENGERINGFLARTPGWRHLARHVWTPVTASDGFFMAVIGRD
ncbi:RsmB/NOP family class I SAM-dependent RNA methyltransferase [Rhodobacterales bacterium HKCCE2091]|nr:RsmB/NOP family class I SAM-dependent RNA methyltransferase [Rhodobacterales bacterium HKCCE2091]